MMEPPSEHHVCAKCLVALDWHPEEGWVHPLGQVILVDGVAGHKPVPVPYDAVLEHRSRCDFCWERDPVWTFPCASFMHEPQDQFIYEGSHEDWAACERCHDIIERGDRLALVYRYKKHDPTFKDLSRKERDEIEVMVHRMMRKFFEHRTGPAYRHV